MITNEILLVQIAESKKLGELTPELFRSFVDIASRRIKTAQYKHLDYPDDKVNYAVEQLCKSWAKFEPDKSQNPFAYFMTIVTQSFRKRN